MHCTPDAHRFTLHLSGFTRIQGFFIKSDNSLESTPFQPLTDYRMRQLTATLLMDTFIVVKRKFNLFSLLAKDCYLVKWRRRMSYHRHSCSDIFGSLIDQMLASVDILDLCWCRSEMKVKLFNDIFCIPKLKTTFQT